MTFYFYDLETSGFNQRTARIMQFAGQRTDMDLKPIGEPDNILIKMTPEVLPDPDAILVHGITPQQTQTDGLSEAEFLKYFHEHIATAETIFVGYNNIRFDDDFIRFTNWRNFYDAYEWAWKDGRSRWDLLDVARMTRALRPDGIKWPFAPDGKPSNRLEMLASINNLEQANAHDALSDVNATIDLAKLIKTKQPKLFDYLLKHKDKKIIAPLITKGDPVVYTSGRYPSEFEKTAVTVMVTQKDDKSGALMYDLRIDPDEFKDLSAAELAQRWAARGKDVPYFPVKTLSYNKSPAVAPLEVLEKSDGYAKLKLDKETISLHLKKLRAAKDFDDKLIKALDIMWPKAQPRMMADQLEVDSLLYDGFVSDADKTKMSVVRAANVQELVDLNLNFSDERLKLLLPLYKARNYPTSLTGEEQEGWENFRRLRLLDGGENSRAARFFKRLGELEKRTDLAEQDRFLLEELNLYGQSLVPVE